MIFSSITFLFYFLPLFLFLYFISPFKNTVLLIASLLFYAWGEATYTLILLLSIAINYVFGLLIAHYEHKNKVIVGVGIAVNLALITYFKYFNFIAQDLLALEQQEPVHLPLGISFFTFQAISYLIDVYRKEAEVEKNPFNLALYISMFPQLIAGPIVRFKTVAKQIKQRVSSLEGISQGIKVFVVGLAQKALIANGVAETADQIFSLPETTLTMSVAWLGSVCYSIQIYFDFAGYSNMAIGLGLIMGFTFPKNFNYPYVSQSITEFWRRWHMSLSSWFRDYLYIPLGGNRVSPARTYLNLLLVFLLCGLWHGAAWTFILWGAYHGFFLMLERYKLSSLLVKFYRPLRHLYTLIVVLLGWVIFRAENFTHFLYYIKTMFALGSGASNVETFGYFANRTLISIIILAGIISTPLYPSLKKFIHWYKGKHLVFIPATIVLELFYLTIFLLSILTVASGSYNPFIYFRF